MPQGDDPSTPGASPPVYVKNWVLMLDGFVKRDRLRDRPLLAEEMSDTMQEPFLADPSTGDDVTVDVVDHAGGGGVVGCLTVRSKLPRAVVDRDSDWVARGWTITFETVEVATAT